MTRDETIENRRFGKTRRRLLIAGILLWIAVPFVFWIVSDVDHQFGNISAVGLILFGGLFVASAILSWVSWRWTVALGLTTAAGIYGASQIVEFKGFTGELIPILALKKEPMSNNVIAIDAANKFNIDPVLVEAAARSSSTQLLGNERTGNVLAPDFATEWDQQPPKILWRRPIGLGWSGLVVRDRKIFTLYQSGQKETIAALDLLTGATLWETKVDGYHTHPLGGTGPRATSTISGDLLVSQTASGQLVVCKLSSGEIVWKQDLIEWGGWSLSQSEKAITWGRSGSPLVVDREGKPIVVVPLGGAAGNPEPISMAAFDLSSGELVWRAGRDQIAYSSPVLFNMHGQDHIAIIQENFAVGYSIQDGSEMWRAEWPSSSGGEACASQPVLVGKNRVLLGKGYALGSKLIEIEAPNTETQNGNRSEVAGWSVKTVWDHTSLLKTKFTSAIYHQEKLFGLSDGILECVDPNSGKRVWKKGRFGQGQLLIVNDRLLVSTEDGRVVLVHPDRGELIYEMPVVEGITWNIPTVAGPFLLVRNGEEIACLYSPATTDASQTAPESAGASEQ
ncbi:MAG: PQQ-binding-like beta-propeller repeat protein [Pirellula sp.]|nr:PQQ-binding-like beta-propeller repeat protein [Pirellula sp.]